MYKHYAQPSLCVLLVYFALTLQLPAADVCCGGQMVPEEECCNDIVLGADEICCENQPTPLEYCCGDKILQVPTEQCCYLDPNGPIPYERSSECCTESGLIQKADPLPEDIDDCPDRVARNPPVPPMDNGECGDDNSRWVPDSYFFIVDFSGCCVEHDHCYSTCNSGKGNCDASLSLCMSGKCLTSTPLYLWPFLMQDCLAQAAIYYIALTAAPSSYSGYISAQREECQCCP